MCHQMTKKQGHYSLLVKMASYRSLSSKTDSVIDDCLLN